MWGDLEDLRTVKALKESIGRLETLLKVQPEVVVCDLQFKYNSTVGGRGARASGSEGAASLCTYFILHGRNDWEEKVIGVSLTEQAMEPDGTIWEAESSWLQTVKDLQGLEV